VKPLPVPAAHNHPDYQVRVIDRVIAILNEVAAGYWQGAYSHFGSGTPDSGGDEHVPEKKTA
jgi:hypothetical protein